MEAVNDLVTIQALSSFWNKTQFTIGIDDTPGTSNHDRTQEISSELYRNLVEEAVNRWNRVLHRQDIQTSFPNASQINFDILDHADGTEDIHVTWWEQNEMNGLTLITPLNDLVANYAIILIAKHKQGSIWHNSDQIHSIVAHELGHVLGLGHVTRWGHNPFTNDLMITGTGNQPDPLRRISNLDLRLINMRFGARTESDRRNFTSPISIPSSEWQNLE